MDPSDSNKKAKEAPASSSSSCSAESGSGCTLPEEAGPSPRPLPLALLPDTAHDLVAAYLSPRDLRLLMEAGHWALQAYGGRVKDVVLHCSRYHNRTTIASLLQRRPGLERVTLTDWNSTAGLVEAVDNGHCDKIQALELKAEYYGSFIRSTEPLLLLQCLGKGGMPFLDRLLITLRARGDGDALIHNLGAALRSRGCEALEELRLESYDLLDLAYDALATWLHLTKAPRLRLLSLGSITSNVAIALSSPAVAPQLASLSLFHISPQPLTHISAAILGKAWPHLQELELTLDGDTTAVPRLMEAIGVGARDLRKLALNGTVTGPEGGVAVARALRDGAAPRLEQLWFSMSYVGDLGVVELARALKSAPCSRTLRRLKLNSCDIGPEGITELASALAQAAAPNLQFLDLGDNNLEDDGVCSLAEAVQEGALDCLRELNLTFVNVGDFGVSALFQALGEGNGCPKLVKLDLSHNDELDGSVVKEMIAELENRRGPGKKVNVVLNLDDGFLTSTSEEESEEEDEEEEGASEED